MRNILLFFLFFVLVAGYRKKKDAYRIPEDSSYRIQRSADPDRYRHRIQRSDDSSYRYRIVDDFPYKIQRSDDSSYRIQRSADPDRYRHRIQRSDDSSYRIQKSNDPDRYRYRIQRSDDSSYRIQRSIDPYRYRYRINTYRIHNPLDDNYRFYETSESASEPTMNITKLGLNCTDKDRQILLTASLKYFNVSNLNLNKLPPVNWTINVVFNGDYKENQKRYNDFYASIKNVSEYCFYQSSIEKLVDNSTGFGIFDSYEYVDLYPTLALYYKTEDEKNALTCYENTSLVCEPMLGKPFDTCKQYQGLLECYLGIYDNARCPSGVRSDICNLIAEDLKRDEVVDPGCFDQLHQYCGARAVSVLFGTSLLIIVHFCKKLL